MANVAPVPAKSTELYYGETKLLTLQFAAAALSGLLLVATFPKPNLTPLSFVALIPLLWVAARERSAPRRFAFGFVSGCVFFGGTCYWIYAVMRTFGGLGVAASAGVFVLFSLVLAGYLGVFAWISGHFLKRAWAPLAVPLLWVAIEYARTYLISGFPWLLLGYALTDWGGMAKVTRWTGVYGLSFLAAAGNAAFFVLASRRNKASAIYLAAVAAAILTLALAFQAESYTEDKKVFLVQTQIPLETALQPWEMNVQAPLLARLHALSTQAVGRQDPPALVIWPETPAPFYFDEQSFSRPLAQAIARQTNSYFMMGIVSYVPGPDGLPDESRPMNSAVLLDPSGAVVSQYDKMHLVPFGEYVPLKKWLGFADKLTAEVSDFVSGTRYVVSQLPGGGMADVICYEEIFPDLVRRFVREGANVLVNTSNDGWYGDSAARDQLLLMARMRAIENKRYLLRATNTGYTAIVRPDGSIARGIPADQPDVLEGHWAYIREQTFYSRHGDVFAIAASVLTVLAIAAAILESRTARRHLIG